MAPKTKETRRSKGSLSFLSGLFGRSSESKGNDGSNDKPQAPRIVEHNNAETDEGKQKQKQKQNKASASSNGEASGKENGGPGRGTGPHESENGSSKKKSGGAGTGGRLHTMSLVDGELDRYWPLSALLGYKDITLSWALRLRIVSDTVGDLRAVHDAECIHGDVGIQSMVLTDQLHCKLRDTGSVKRAPTSSYSGSRDILGIGCVLIQLLTHRDLQLQNPEAGKGPSATLVPKLNRLVTLELSRAKGPEDEDEIFELSDDLEFMEALDAELRALWNDEANVKDLPRNAKDSLTELCVQCCSATRDSRPDVVMLQDWLGSVIEDAKDAALVSNDELLAVLDNIQGKDDELMGEVSVASESKFVTGNPTINEDGYETDDSYMPPKKGGKKGGDVDDDDDDDDDADNEKGEDEESSAMTHKHRRRSRLSQFIEQQAPAAPAESDDSEEQYDKGPQPLGEGGGKGGHGGEWATRKARRASHKPSAQTMSRFSMMWGGGSGSTAQLLGGNHGSSKVIQPSECAERFDKQERLTVSEVNALLSAADKILKKDPNMPTVDAPVVVIGDIHGQYFDLRNMLQSSGNPANTKYIFLGDYVDRGDFSCEVLLYLFSLKVAYPNNIVMIRGNHECDTVSSYFGFKEECEQKYGRTVFHRCISSFQAMPIAVLLETGGAGRFLCCHGGISPHVTTLDQIREYNRFTEPGMNGFLCDLLWSDPIRDNFDDGHQESLGDFLSIDYVSNPARGCSYRYGYRAIIGFLATNKLAAIIRAHEVQQEGFRYHFQDITGGGMGNTKARIMPPVITVFSAPNYCGRYGNLGAYLKVAAVPQSKKAMGGGGFKPIDLLEPVQFDAVESPEPIVLENETEKQNVRIETTCPYMPTTFQTFVARAREFGHQQDEVVEGGGGDESVMERIPGMELNHLNDDAASQYRKDLVRVEPGMMQTADLSRLLSASKSKRHQQETDQLSKAARVKNLIAQYEEAAAVDGINEMHPELVKKKYQEAKKKLEAKKGLGGSKKAIEKAHMTVSPLTHQDSGVSVDATGAPSIDPGTDDEVIFSGDELIALQMLFLLIDRQDDGTIDAEDLIAWSSEEGNVVPADEAELCVTALDHDQDGKIGFADYLSFAAAMKQRWVLAESTKKTHLGGLLRPAHASTDRRSKR